MQIDSHALLITARLMILIMSYQISTPCLEKVQRLGGQRFIYLFNYIYSIHMGLVINHLEGENLVKDDQFYYNVGMKRLQEKLGETKILLPR